MTCPTMKAKLIARLRKGWITTLEAAEQVGCWSLSQRCGELRRAGMKVADKWVTLPSGKRVKAFRLGK